MKYTANQIDNMKKALCKKEAEEILLEESNCDISIYDILMNGNIGWDNLPNEEIIECYDFYIEKKEIIDLKKEIIDLKIKISELELIQALDNLKKDF